MFQADNIICPNKHVPETPEVVGTVWHQQLCFHWLLALKAHSSHRRCPPLHSPFRHGPLSPARLKVCAAWRTSLSITSQNDLFIITWRSEQTFSFYLNASRYTFPWLGAVLGLLMAFEESFLQVTSHRRQLWFTITVTIRVGWHSSGNSFD